MAYKDPEKQKEYMKKYYEEKIKGNEEARLKKNERQREYVKRTGNHTSREATQRYQKKTYKSYKINFRIVEDAEIITEIESAKINGVSPTDFCRNIFKKYLK